nr:GGDEF domain-containing protein [Motiliproteus sediminis]
MDVTQTHAYQEKLEQLSITDPLTGVFNRRHFFDRMAPACAQARRDNAPLSFAMLDIDHFKAVNDDHGHLFGDEVLSHFAALLKRHCRPYDLVARYGGEEFAVLFIGIDRVQAQTVLSRYREALIASPVRRGKATLTCYFSAGIADLCELEELNDCAKLVEIADSRLYRAKAAGRDRIFVDSEGSASS